MTGGCLVQATASPCGTSRAETAVNCQPEKRLPARLTAFLAPTLDLPL